MITIKEIPEKQENKLLNDNYDLIIKDFKKICITNLENLLDDCIMGVKSPWIIINMIKTSFKEIKIKRW